MVVPKLRPDWGAADPVPWLLRSGVIILILAVCGLTVDFAAWGPIRAWAWQTRVVAPVEQAWGFHAELKQLPTVGEQLVVTSVVGNGPFAAAGIRPGAIIPNPRCSWYAMSGGFYGTLSEAKDEAAVRLVVDPGQNPNGVIVRVSRKSAT